MTAQMTIRLPDDIYEKLRRESYDTRISMNSLIIERLGLEVNPETYGLLCALFEAAWHHDVPESLDGLEPATSQEARKLANLVIKAILP